MVSDWLCRYPLPTTELSGFDRAIPADCAGCCRHVPLIALAAAAHILEFFLVVYVPVDSVLLRLGIVL